MAKTSTALLKRIVEPKYGLLVHATFRFAPDDPSNTDPSNAQLKRFLQLKKSNVLLPGNGIKTIFSKQSALKSIQPAFRKNPPFKTWKESMVYELTGVKFANIVPNTMDIRDSTVKLSFVVDVKKLASYFRTRDAKEATQALMDEMNVRSDSISQQVYFHYMTPKRTYAYAILTRARAKMASELVSL